MKTIGVNQSGVITSLLVKDHPKWMWYREAVQNALEASQSYITEKKIKVPVHIDIRKLDVTGLIQETTDDGTEYDLYKNKLSFLNYGGMDAPELIHALKIGGSGKTSSLNANYGVGIKTSILDFSDLLMITYKNGKGHYAWIGKEYTNGIDFDIVSYSEDDYGNPVEECTEWVNANAIYRGYDLEHDFTEVIVLGREPNQDTFLHPFGFGPQGEELKKVSANHIKEHLCKRYARLPQGLQIRLHPSANTNCGGSDVIFQTYEQAFEAALENEKIEDKPRKEVVTTEDGIKIHYFYDAPVGENYVQSNDNATLKYLQRSSWQTAFSGFVWRNEFYDVKADNNPSWRSVAFRLGIQDEFKRFRIWVELPDKAVTTDKYRVELQTETQVLKFDDDSNLTMIVANMPEWFKDIANSTKKDVNTNYNDKLNQLFAEYMDLDRPIIGRPNGHKGSMEQRTASNTGSKKTKTKGGKGSKQRKFSNPALVGPQTPEIREDFNKSKSDNFAEIHLKAGSEGNDLIMINSNYCSIETLAHRAAMKVTSTPDDYLDIAKTMSQDEMVLVVALWLMICRSRYAEENMSSEEFNISVDSGFLETYLFSREVSILDSIKSRLRSKWKDDQKTIRDFEPELETA
jgi:hypothetical protein